MTKYKLYNTIKRELLKNFKPEKIHKGKISFSRLRNLSDKYTISELCEKYYCCYGEDKNCWIEATSSWISSSSDSPKSRNKKILKQFKKIIQKYGIENRNVFICENNRIILICIPLRDVSKEDIYMIFSKKQMLS